MPTINDKLAAEQNNERNILLWPEGSFYKVYERSAFLFVSQVRPYEVRRRFVQAAGRDVVSTGFPQKVLNSLSFPTDRLTDGSVRIRLEGALDEQQFQLWRESCADCTENQSFRGRHDPKKLTLCAPCTTSAESEVCRRIRELDLAGVTPMSCLMLLAELQKILRQGNE